MMEEAAVTHAVTELDDCAIAVDAGYYLQRVLISGNPCNEPLVAALAGMMGFSKMVETDLDQWKEHRVTPFFIFSGQPITGQDDISIMRGRRGNEDTDEAWRMYWSGEPGRAVEEFGAGSGAFSVERLYPELQSILRKRQLHFLVAPYNAAAQMAYLDMIDSDQCAGLMGPLELLVYPIKDCIIRSINWKTKTVSAISKKHILKVLNVSEMLFIDAFLMAGTSFLAPFPPLLEASIVPVQPPTVRDAVNVLRTHEKSVTQACTSFLDLLQDRDWLRQYRRARMAVHHFVYIAESGEVEVHEFSRLTKDSHAFIGYRLPPELYWYLSTGLIGPRVLSWLTHGQLHVFPPLDGNARDEYRKLVTSQLVPVKEAALGLLTPRLNRGLAYKPITLEVWYDAAFSSTLDNQKPDLVKRVSRWTVDMSALHVHFPQFAHGSIASEVLALQKLDAAASTVLPEKEKLKGLQSADAVVTLVIWRFLHLRGYVDDFHRLTAWGSALAAAMSALEPTARANPDVGHLPESLLLAFEMLRYGLLDKEHKNEQDGGYPMHGTKDDKASVLLVSRCATFLKIRHQAIGYTGPLSKNLLAFNSLIAEVRNADRDLVDAIVASLFMHAQAKRHRSDMWELGHRLPFLFSPDTGLAIAAKTWLDDTVQTPPEQWAGNKAKFAENNMPQALCLWADLNICYAFFNAIHAGVKTLDVKYMPAAELAEWDKTSRFLQSRMNV